MVQAQQDKTATFAGTAPASALGGLRVVDLSNRRTGAQASQLFADFGAEVIQVEPPGGSALRKEAAWPSWARGKQAIELDLKAAADVETAKGLIASADVVIETFRPGVADRLGLGYAAMSALNPRLVYASITGFGSHGPYTDLQGYEGIVISKVGVPWALAGMADREGPAFPSAAYASYPASQLAIQAILAALYERETSGVGQRVETSLVEAITVHDVFPFFARVVAQRFADAFVQKPRAVDGIPTGGLSFRLLVALTKDGRWLQFSQTADPLFRAMMRMFGLEWMFDDPEWASLPNFDDVDQRVAFWERLLNFVRSKTLAEWQAEFDRDPNVWGELFHRKQEVLHHPQMVWNGFVAETSDPDLGKVRQLGPLLRMSETPADVGRPAPRPGEHDAELRALARAARPSAEPAPPALAPKGRRPLEGVTIVELSTYYAGPYGATLLAELGARVIKLEALEGDPHRWLLPFPEVANIKALQGKESVAIDLRSAEGREIAHRIIGSADILLQSFRGDSARRLGLDSETLRQLNPDLIYHVGAGYGQDGPCGHRPAFAPTIGAAAGLAWRNAGSVIPERDDLSLDQVKAASVRLGTAVLGVGNSDALSAVSVATALMLGLYARQRGAGGQDMMTSMVASTAHCLAEMAIEYEGAPEVTLADPGLHGFSALYRLYETAEEWVFLAAPSEREWARLTSALADGASLAADPRFATAQARRENDEALAQALGDIFRRRPAAEWETELRAADVACVEVARGPMEANYLDEGSLGQRSGFITTAHHKMLDEIPRMAPLVHFSRSATVAGNASLTGEHTEQVLLEYGYSRDEISRLADKKVILLG